MRTVYAILNLLANIAIFIFFIFLTSELNAQVSIPNTSPVTENFTGFTGAATPTNWAVQGTGTRGTTWNGTTQTTGSSGGWYGNNNMSFLGSNQATNGNATWLLQNNTGVSITGFTLSFTATMWKTGTASPTVTVSYSSSSSSANPAQGALANLLSSLTFSDATANITTGAVMTQTITTANVNPGDYIFIRFIHQGGGNSDNLGWANVQFTAITSQANISSSGPSAGNIYPSTTSNILQAFSVTPIATGLTLSSLTVNSGGTYAITDLASTPFKLFANTNPTLSGASQIGTVQAAVASGGAITFSGLSQSIAVGVTEYFIVTVDLSNTAVLGNTIYLTSTAFSNIVFTATIIKNGTNPVAAGNAQTIAPAVSVSNAGTPAAGNIGYNSTDNAILGFQVTPAGTSSLTDFTTLTITASGSVTNADMYNFKVVKDVDASGDYSGGDVVVSNSVAFSSSMTFTISGETGISSATKYLVLGDTYGNTGVTITLSINNNSNIVFSNPITSSAPYSGNTQTIVNTGSVSLTSDYFRSVKTNGNWTSTTTWESSTDNATWHVATLYPTQTTNRNILIQNNTTVTIDSAIKAKRVIVQSGGTLVQNNAITYTIVDVTTAGVTELTVNGTFVLKGTMPTIQSGAEVVVNNGGVVRVDANTAGQSDDFVRLTTVEFKTGSMVYWNTNDFFETDNATYFVGPNYATNKPIFRISPAVTGSFQVGANTPTVFNSKFESYGSNVVFKNSGSKTFRDGFGGATVSGAQAKITHSTNSGTFYITASDAVIDGTVILNIDNSPTGTSDLEITESSYTTISGSPTINVGNSGTTGSDFLISGTVKHNGSIPVLLTYGNLIVNGYIASGSTGTFQANNSIATITNIIVGSNSTNNSANAGTLVLTSGFTNVNTFTMQRTVSRTNPSIVMGSDIIVNKLVLTKGIAATDNHLLTYNKTSTLTSPSSALYSDSYICTCNSSGIEITPTGNNGFRINNVSGNTDQIFPVGTNFNSANRMAINMNNSTADNFTVVVGIGDIGGTPKPKVNRIWYVSENTAGGSTATMKLYFTKRDWNTYSYGSAQNDEIETGFNYADPHLVQKNYSNLFVNVATTGTADIPDYTASSYLSEIFGRYYLGISKDYLNATNGINVFTKFSVVNADGIVLPIPIINAKAYQKGSGVAIDWSALNELNISKYEVERSADAVNFTSILSVAGINNGSALTNYNLTDNAPNKGNNFYRIKATDKEGNVFYSAILSVNISANGNTFVLIYPNPVKNRQMNVQLNNVPAGKYQVAVYNYLGQQLTTKFIQHDGGSAIQNINLPAYTKPGVYVVKVINETKTFSSKVVVE